MFCLVSRSERHPSAARSGSSRIGRSSSSSSSSEIMALACSTTPRRVVAIRSVSFPFLQLISAKLLCVPSAVIAIFFSTLILLAFQAPNGPKIHYYITPTCLTFFWDVAGASSCPEASWLRLEAPSRSCLPEAKPRWCEASPPRGFLDPAPRWVATPYHCYRSLEASSRCFELPSLGPEVSSPTSSSSSCCLATPPSCLGTPQPRLEVSYPHQEAP